MTFFTRIVAFIGAFALLAGIPAAFAQQEFPPPQGKGRVVVVFSGVAGPSQVAAVASDVSKLGYDVVLLDGNTLKGSHGAAVKSAIQQALSMQHALPGKVALVGFSSGGGQALYYGTQLPDQVAGVVVWYPASSFIRNVPGFADHLEVPVVAFAGGQDHFLNGCCTAANDEALQSAAKGAGKSFDLTVYPDADHEFAKGGSNYNAKDYEDAFQRTAQALKMYLAN
jgi:dienelactone hydrolase